MISIHAPHAGRDQNTLHFQTYKKHFNPRAPCGARPSKEQQRKRRVCISIHAPHAGRDERDAARRARSRNFNPRAPCGARLAAHRHGFVVVDISIHAPHAGRDSIWLSQAARRKVFQSTRPMRGATSLLICLLTESDFISIHAPHAGRDVSLLPRPPLPRHFNPRAPCGARPRCSNCHKLRRPISIHAPHAGRDSTGSLASLQRSRFQSTRPMRGATIALAVNRVLHGFQSTRPMRGATSRRSTTPRPASFQSTRPMRGATPTRAGAAIFPTDFNPRAPCGARLVSNCHISAGHHDFNPRAPCGARRGVLHDGIGRGLISIHAPHAGRDP